MSEHRLPCSDTSECQRSAWCVEQHQCWRSLPEDERAYRTWHDAQMAKPFDERNFE